MTFITESRLRRSFQKFQRQAQHVDWIPGRTGKIEPSSGLLNPNPRAGLQPNQIWVRKHAKAANDTGRGHAAVWNTTFAVSTDRADTPVWIGKDPEGEYEIKGLRNRDASNQLGAALNTVMQKIVPPELWRQLHRILNVMELRPYLRGDDTLGFKPGWIGRLYWDDSSGIDPLLFATSTSGQQAWVVVYMDTTGGALSLDAATGADITAGLPKDRADIESVLATLPAGAFPLFALLLKESDTSFSVTDEALTEDLRDRWTSGGQAFADPVSLPISISSAMILPTNRQIIAGKFEFTGSGSITLQGTASIYFV